MLTKKRAYEIIDLISENSKYYTTIALAFKEEGLTRFANSEIHQNVYNCNTEVEINIIHDKKISSVTTNVLEDEALLRALRDAEEKLPFLPEGTIELPEMDSADPIEKEGYSEELNMAFSIQRRAELLKAGIVILEEDYIAAGAFSLTNDGIVWGNTNGVRRYLSSSDASFNAMVMHDSGASSYIDISAGQLADLDVVAEFEKLFVKAKKALNPISIEPGKYDVILEPLAVGNLVMFTGYIGMSSKFHQIGMSCFADSIGEKVLGDNITIVDDVNNPNTYPMTFDFEGYERKSLNLIENGVLNEIAYDTITAINAGTETTGHSVGYKGEGGIPLNLVVSPGNSSIEEMIKSTKKGLLVSRFHYMNIVNPRQGLLTALTRDGLFLIEDGEIKAPVYNLRFTDSIQNIFSNVEAITVDRKRTPSFIGTNYVPGMKIKDFHFTGKTEID